MDVGFHFEGEPAPIAPALHKLEGQPDPLVRSALSKGARTMHPEQPPFVLTSQEEPLSPEGDEGTTPWARP